MHRIKCRMLCIDTAQLDLQPTLFPQIGGNHKISFGSEWSEWRAEFLYNSQNMYAPFRIIHIAHNVSAQHIDCTIFHKNPFTYTMCELCTRRCILLQSNRKAFLFYGNAKEIFAISHPLCYDKNSNASCSSDITRVTITHYNIGYTKQTVIDMHSITNAFPSIFHFPFSTFHVL